MYNDHKFNPLHLMLPKTIAYVKSYDGQTKWIYFLIKDETYQKNIILFGIKSAFIKKKNFTANLPTIKILFIYLFIYFENQN